MKEYCARDARCESRYVTVRVYDYEIEAGQPDAVVVCLLNDTDYSYTIPFLATNGVDS